jgi:hypothetical protein
LAAFLHYIAGMQTIALPSPGMRSRIEQDSALPGKETLRVTPTLSGSDDGFRLGVYVLLVLVALFTGYVLGLLGGQASNASRFDRPSVPTNPRSFNP